MDADMIRPSSPESQMEMLMMQLDKLPHFSDTYTTTTSAAAELQETQFYGDVSAAIQTPPPPFLRNPNQTSPNNPFPITGSPIHQQPSSYSPELRPEISFRNNRESMEAMREMIFRVAVMQPVQIDADSLKPPRRRKNVRISKDPQSVAARHRRERISERIRILQRLVPGGTKMDTASMLDEAVHYVKFLKKQVQSLERAGANRSFDFGFSAAAAMAGMANVNCLSLGKGFLQPAQMVGSLQMLS